MAKPRYKYFGIYKFGAYVSMALGFAAFTLGSSYLGFLDIDDPDFANGVLGFVIGVTGIFAGFHAYDAICDFIFGTE